MRDNTMTKYSESAELKIKIDFEDAKSVGDTLCEFSIAFVSLLIPKEYIGKFFKNSKELLELQDELIETSLIIVQILRISSKFKEMLEDERVKTKTAFVGFVTVYNDLSKKYIEAKNISKIDKHFQSL
jgi:hypothetical protein